MRGGMLVIGLGHGVGPGKKSPKRVPPDEGMESPKDESLESPEHEAAEGECPECGCEMGDSGECDECGYKKPAAPKGKSLGVTIVLGAPKNHGMMRKPRG